MLGDNRDRILEQIAASLPASLRPWTIEVEDDLAYDRIVIRLEHEASNGRIFNIENASIEQVLENVRAWMSELRELPRVAAAPIIEHPEDVEFVQTMATAFGWSQIEVRCVATHLAARGLLNSAESEWLSAWFGHDGPAPRGRLDP